MQRAVSDFPTIPTPTRLSKVQVSFPPLDRRRGSDWTVITKFRDLSGRLRFPFSSAISNEHSAREIYAIPGTQNPEARKLEFRGTDTNEKNRRPPPRPPLINIPSFPTFPKVCCGGKV